MLSAKVSKNTLLIIIIFELHCKKKNVNSNEFEIHINPTA